ncbi:MAG: hypothetical protein JWL84_3243 [Rhodospirillales bacterium]|nr:hypothetical protein [Rhodospirillales bacterium]
MQTTTSGIRPGLGSSISSAGEAAHTAEASHSAVSWPAIIAGAAAAAAVSLILISLGTGLGLATVSPWPNSGASATTFAVGAAIWLIVVQWLASALGGYLTGRLRTKWVGTHNHEVFFRDTAHGFLSWAVATLFVIVIVASGAASVVSGGARALTSVASGAAQGAASGGAGAAAQSGPTDPTGYLVDTLFRSDRPDPNANSAEVKQEATRILATTLANGSIAPADKTYLAQLVAARTGIAQPDAEKRIDDMVAQAKAAETKAREAADAARKATTKLAFYSFFALLIGAFIASAAGALGGHERDEW